MCKIAVLLLLLCLSFLLPLAGQQTATAETDPLSGLVAEMPATAALLDRCAHDLRAHRETTDTVMKEFHGKWQLDHRLLTGLAPERLADPLRAERLKRFYSLLAQIAEIVSLQHERVAADNRKDYLNYLSLEQVSGLSGIILKADLMIAEFHPHYRRKSSFPHLGEWLKALSFLHVRHVCLDNAKKYASAGEVSKAVAECDKILQLYPDDCEVLLERALLLLLQKKSTSAKQDWERAQRLGQQDNLRQRFAAVCAAKEKTVSARAAACFKDKQYRQAIACWQFVLLLNPRHEQARNQLKEAQKLLQEK